MLCIPEELGKKSIPGELKKAESPAANLFRDFTIAFVLADFRNTLQMDPVELSSIIGSIDQSPTYSLNERLPLEGVMLLPCLYCELQMPPRTA